MPDNFQIVNADPRMWPEWDELVSREEVRALRALYCSGECTNYFNRQDLTNEEFMARLRVLATIWGGEIVSG